MQKEIPMNLKSAFGLLAAGTFLVACGADEVVNINDEAKEKATIALKLMDMNSGEPIDSATVYSVLEDEQNVTDSNGLSIWEKQVLGSHAFQISKDGYASILYTVVLNEQGQGNVARVGDEISQIKLPKGGVSAKGVVLYPDESGSMTAAAGVTVYAIPDANDLGCPTCSFVPQEYTAETDKQGVYEFKNLPEGVSIVVKVGQNTINKKNYKGTNVENIAASRAGEFNNVNLINMGPVTEAIALVSNNLKKVTDASTALKFTFSTEVEADSLDAGNWTVMNMTTNKDILVTVAVSEKKSVTIKPYSGKWDTTASYMVAGRAFTTEGEYEDVAGSFKVGAAAATAAPANVTGLAAKVGEDFYGDPDNDVVVLTWTAPKGVFDGYALYYKTNLMAEYQELTSSSDVTRKSFELDLARTVTSYGDIDVVGAKTVSFILLPYSVDASGTVILADMTKAKAVEYKVPTDDL